MPRTLEITAPNGRKFRIEAPDDATDEQIEAAAREASGVGEAYPVQNEAKPTSFTQGVEEGATNVLNHAADWVESGLNAGGEALGLGKVGDAIQSVGPMLGMAGSVDQAMQNQQIEAAASPSQGSGFGRFVGEVAGTLPLAMLPGGVMAQGALGGALLSDANTAGGVARDASIGAIGGKVGQKLFQGAAQLAAPVVGDALGTLIQAGTRTTPGQTARAVGGLRGRVLSAVEDRATSLPGVGDMIARDRTVANQTFNESAINRALEPIGQSLPRGLRAGRRAIRYAGDKLSAAYAEVLPNIRATGDEQFTNDLAAIQQETADMLPERLQQFNGILGGLGRFFKNGTDLDGEAFKAIETRLGDKARKFSRSQDADQQELGDALSSVLESVREMAARQNPEAAEQLRAINKGWKSLTQVEKAGLTSKGEFSPAGYSQAVRQSSDTVRRRGYARGDALNQDLSDAASEILPSEIPDSGTATRWSQANLPALAIGAAGAIPYAAARGVNAAVTRQNYMSPALAQLLQFGAQGAPALSAGAIQTLRGPTP